MGTFVQAAYWKLKQQLEDIRNDKVEMKKQLQTFHAATQQHQKRKHLQSSWRYENPEMGTDQNPISNHSNLSEPEEKESRQPLHHRNTEGGNKSGKVTPQAKPFFQITRPPDTKDNMLHYKLHCPPNINF
ncbi:hypothetical protein JTB14_017720 [Gonioctena quinquepunctata]|nr:hypothetical protein JTB14_017720 [Gonioctena quinquepunctata]